MIVAEAPRLGQIVDLLAPGSKGEFDDAMKSLKVMSVNLDKNVDDAIPYVKYGMIIVAVGVVIMALISLRSYLESR